MNDYVQIKFSLLGLMMILLLAACDNAEVKGIFIDHTLYENLSITEQIELKNLVRETLAKKEQALSKLINFWCGGGAGCYDLGFIITQIIYRIGESEFIKMTSKLTIAEIEELQFLIAAGLEYGDNDKDGEMDDKRFDTEFPSLYKKLSDKVSN